MSIEEKIRQLAEAQAVNERARAELGQILADLPISGYGRLEYEEEEWGVDVHWHTPKNVIFSAHSLIPHECTEDCEQFCEQVWDYEPLRAEWLIKAVFQLFIERIEELERGTEVINAACAIFGSPKAGIGQLKEAVRAYESK